MRLYFVCLRRPAGYEDRRSDPFWEFGSFGSTGCHSRNLLHPVRSVLRDDDRLAFVQGGDGESRVIALTPPIKIGGSLHKLEVLWDKSYRPLPFVNAPVLVDNRGNSDFSTAIDALRLEAVNRTTYCGALSSRLRSSKKEIPVALATEIVRWFFRPDLPRADRYYEAIEPLDGYWYRHAEQQRWGSIGNRRGMYTGVLLSRRSGCVVSASKKKSSSC